MDGLTKPGRKKITAVRPLDLISNRGLDTTPLDDTLLDGDEQTSHAEPLNGDDQSLYAESQMDIQDTGSVSDSLEVSEEHEEESDDQSSSSMDPSEEGEDVFPLRPAPPVFHPPNRPPPRPPGPFALWRARDDRLLYYLARKVRGNLTNAEMEWMFYDVQAAGMQQPAVSLPDVLRFEQTLLDRFMVHTFGKCPLCSGLADPNSRCANQQCSTHLARQGTMSEIKKFTSVDIFPQLKAVVEENMASIVDLHTLVHGGMDPDTDDVHFYERFKGNMEDLAAFNQHNIKVQLILNSDGFSMPDAYSGEIWPVSLAVLDLPKSSRFATKNLITAATYRHSSHPSVDDMDDLLRRLEGDLAANRRFQVAYQGVLYSVRVEVTAVACDNQALRTLYDVQLYEAGKCGHCTVQAVHSAGSYRYDLTAHQAKDHVYIMANAPLRQGGYRSVTALTRICSMANSIIDLMHVFDEGILKDLLKDMSGNRRPGLKVQTAVLKRVDQLCSQIRFPTYYYTRMLPITNFRQLTAKQLHCHGFITIPLLVLLGHLPGTVEAAYTIILLSIERRLMTAGLTRGELTEASHGLDACAALWDDIFGRDTTTYKTHLYLGHVPEQLRTCGNILEEDVSGFEHNNMTWKMLMHPTNTRSFDDASEKRLLLLNYITSEIDSKGDDSVVAGLRKMKTDREHLKNRVIRRAVEIGDDVSLPERSMHAPLPGDPLHYLVREMELSGPGPFAYYERFKWRGAAIATHHYWPIPSKTQQDVVVLRQNGMQYMGKVVLIAVEIPTGVLRMVVELFDTESISLRLYDQIARILYHPSKAVLLRLYRQFVMNHNYIMKIRQGPRDIEVFTVNEIVSLAAEMQFDGVDYCVALPSRRVWQ